MVGAIRNIRQKMFSFYAGAARERVGIEFGSNRLKIAQLRIYPSRIEVVSLSSHNISGLSDPDISKLLKSAVASLGAKSPEATDIIPSSQVITKNIEVPSTDPQEIRDIINLQSGRHTPYSREEIIVDYLDIGTYRQSYTKILLVIVARHIIKRHYEILERAGLKLEKVLFAPEGLSCSLSRILKVNSDSVPVNVVHVDESASDFSIVFKNKLLFVRSIPIGAWNLGDEGLVYRSRFADELKRSLEAYQSENIEKMPNLVVVTGAVEGLQDMETQLSESLQIPVKFLAYLGQMALSEKILKGLSGTRQPSFLHICASLFAWNQLSIDLIPEEVKLRRQVEERGRELIKTGILVLALFVLVFSILISKIYFNVAYLKRLETRYAPLIKEATELQQRFEAVGVIKNYLSRRGYALEVLTELYSLSSEDVQLADIRFDQQQGRFVLRGSAETMAAVFSFVEKLEKSPYLKDVKTKYTTRRKEGSRDVTDFEISAVPTHKGS